MVLGGSFAAYLAAMIVDAEREKQRKRIFGGSFDQRYLNVRHGWQGRDRSQPVTWWRGRPESERTILCLIGLNTAVFLAWRLPQLQRFMARWFTHSINSHPVTMLTSTFSHASGIHFLFNMVALYSFGRAVHERMGREQFLAFYISSGLVSSGGSHLLRSYRRDLSHSLGASGAVFGIVGACAHQPNLRVSLILVPFLSVPLGVALPAVMAYDVLGVMKNWKTFDHAAHLSGALFGYAFFKVSLYHIWPSRRKILSAIGYPVK